ncbi:hypothetical protein ACVNIS_14725 [Sphaerotilaceae bacterium SBD11-9]
MGVVLALLGLAFATQIWLCFRVGRSSVALAVATFFIGFPAALFTFFKQRGDPETSVTVAFIANVVCTVLFAVMAWITVVPLLEAQSAEFEAAMAPLVAKGRPSAAAAPASAASAVRAAASEASAASAPELASESLEGFSAALRAAGLTHTVTRLASGQALPPGVTDAALFSVTPLAAAGAASSAAGTELSATLFKCESAKACRNLAGLQMQQAGPNKPRVLQNGLLMLSLPPAKEDDSDLTPTAVVSVFRKL